MCPAFVDAAQPHHFVGYDAYLFVIERAGHLLAVTGDERDGIAFIEQADGGLHLRGSDV
jgi:hypothetical protein